MTQTFEDLLWFVLRNKTNKVFRNMEPLKIATILKVALDENSLWYKEEHGHITGMILAEFNHKLKHIFIKHNLAMKMSTLKEFAARALKEYPDYTLHWYKNDKHKVWHTTRFYHKLGLI